MARMSSTQIVRMAEIEIDPLQLDAYKALLAEEIEASVANEEGVLALYAMSVKGNATQLRILEIYASQDAYETHLKAPHFLKYKAATAAMVRSLRLIEAEPVVLCAKG